MARRDKKEPTVDLRSARPDLAAAATRLGSRLDDPALLTPLDAMLGADESVRFVVQGTLENSIGLLCLTDARLIFFFDHERLPRLDAPLHRVTALHSVAGLVTGQLELTLAGDEKPTAIARITKRDVEPLDHAVRQAVQAAPREQPPEVDPSDLFDALARLAALRDQGVITEEEFAAKKQQLLDRL